jgi:antirestriction protein ArdC
MPTQAEIRQQIANRIVEALKAGTAPWLRPWSSLTNCGIPANVVSRRPYTGVNTLLLDLVARERGWASRWWGTFRQWQGLGCRVKPRPDHVRPGEWGTRVVFCKPIARKPALGRNGEGKEGEAEEHDSRFYLLRTYHVFHAEQVEGGCVGKYLARPRITTPFVDFTPAEEVITATAARIEHGGNRAVYFPDEDFIRLPAKESFESRKEYYSTALHELLHWSGHESRLGRLGKNARFGDAAYAFEELVAEMGGCFLCHETGVPQSDDLGNQAAYLASWLSVLQADPTAIFTAASQASAGADFILSFSRQEEGGAREGCEAAGAGA